MTHRVRYEEVGRLVPWWKLAVGLLLPLYRVRRWCLSYAVAALALLACNKLQVAPAPMVQWDGGSDRATHACAVLAAAGCPAGQSSVCASALRNAQAQPGGPSVDLDCIIDAGPSPSALRGCAVTCGSLP